MIPLEKHYFVYTGYVSTPSIQEFLCALCGETLGRPGGRIEAQGWVGFHINHHTRERYCPVCALKVWPVLYPEALAKTKV